MQPYFAGVPFHAAPTSRQAVSCHSPLCVSCTKIESPQIRRKLFAFKPGFVTPPILTTPVETFRPTSLLRYAAASTGAVVATGSASVNADCDNGVTLHHTAQPRRGHEHAAKRVEASVVLAQLLAQGTSVEDEVHGSLGLIGSEEFVCCVELTCMVPELLLFPTHKSLVLFCRYGSPPSWLTFPSGQQHSVLDLTR